MDVHPKKLPLIKLLDYVHATFQPLTLDRGLSSRSTVGEDVPRETLLGRAAAPADPAQPALQRDQVHRDRPGANCASNRVKDPDSTSDTRANSDDVIAFAVKDTGIGIAPEKLAGDLRGVPAGRRHHQPQVRRHRPRPLHQPGHRRACSAAGSSPRASRASAPPSRSTSPCTTGPPPGLTAVNRAPRAARPSHRRTRRLTGRPEPLPRRALRRRSTCSGPRSPCPAPDRPDGSDDGVSWPETTRLRDWLSGRLAGVLADRRILIVDDDIRNVFALTHVLGRVGISVKYAENGREGLEILDRTLTYHWC